MRITIDLEDFRKYGASSAVLLGYIKQKGKCLASQVQEEFWYTDVRVHQLAKMLEEEKLIEIIQQPEGKNRNFREFRYIGDKKGQYSR